jgi:hypothetical protein
MSQESEDRDRFESFMEQHGFPRTNAPDPRAAVRNLLGGPEKELREKTVTLARFPVAMGWALVTRLPGEGKYATAVRAIEKLENWPADWPCPYAQMGWED